ncbi:beta-1,4-N-acetylgalactosaminyltransferase bre-4-like [Pectinophora gossypiella]|uniref:beta-1,4-N-acetylgalactosaminyltransferase bre-4-like n=1 Tax=Pectinophora gossypiella TaxID=13191 RepID=UPI00214EA636|nr:beta-1,4-N-acetylgalactosaminyltransferase bre-4-like [Pectinophora gossypiella]
MASIPLACYLCVQMPKDTSVPSKPYSSLISQEPAVEDDTAKKLLYNGLKYSFRDVYNMKQAVSRLRKKRIDSRNAHTPVKTTTDSDNVFVKEMMTLNTTRIQVSLDEVFPMVQSGGYYKPPDCHSKHKVAILVPYRNRTRNLTVFLFNIHPFLMNQKLEYRIFVIEQVGFGKFNKGRLFNAGFKEMKKYGEWKCVVFHDVDLLPLSGRILYTCPSFPRHMSSAVIDRTAHTNASSPILFGGVTAMTLEHYEKANGHSNMYWGWGGEDYDMFWRLRAAGIPVVRYNKTVARYLALPHGRERVNPLRYRLLRTAIDRWQEEGLADLEYRVETCFNRHLFTHIRVNINLSGDDAINL